MKTERKTLSILALAGFLGLSPVTLAAQTSIDQPVHSLDDGGGSGSGGSGGGHDGSGGSGGSGNGGSGGGETGGYYGGGTATGGSSGGEDSGIKFYGSVEALPAGATAGVWQIAGRQITATSSTTIDSGIAVGSCVEVQASQQADGTFTATKITLDDASHCSGSTVREQPRFFGSIDSLPTGLIGDWTVAGRTIHVLPATRLEQELGPAVAGACVEVQGTANPDKSITATEVKVVSAAGGCASSAGNLHMNVEFKGAVQSVPQGGLVLGSWLIAGRTVAVDAQTQFSDGIPAVGTCVEVKGSTASDGTVTAQRIKADDSKGCQTTAQLRFYGTVQTMPEGGVGDWLIGGRTVHVSASTIVESDGSPVTAGACVEVRGAAASDGALDAAKLETKDASNCGAATVQAPFEIEGAIESLPPSGTIGDWKIAGRTVQVDSSTKLDSEHGAFLVGACVEANGSMQSDGSLLATRIESHSSSGTCIFNDGVLSAASFTSGSVAPGQIVSLFGAHLGTSTDRAMEVSDDRLATRLGNVRVLFDGTPAALIFVSEHQVNAMVPGTVKPGKHTEIQVENNGAWSNAVSLPVKAASPSLFTVTQSGRGQAAVLNFESETQDYRLNSGSNAASRGSIVVVYGTGHGEVESGDDGRIVRSASRAKLPVRVTIGGHEAEVEYAGSAPGQVSGVFQANVRIPDDSPQGQAIPIVIEFGDDKSQDGVTIAVK